MDTIGPVDMEYVHLNDGGKSFEASLKIRLVLTVKVDERFTVCGAVPVGWILRTAYLSGAQRPEVGDWTPVYTAYKRAL